MKTHRNCYKNKTSITELKKLYSIFYYVREAEIIEKNGHRMCFISSEWIVYELVSPFQRAPKQFGAFFLKSEVLLLSNTASNSFRKLPSSPWAFSSFLYFLCQLQKLWAMKQMVWVKKEENIMVNITCSNSFFIC